MVATPTLYFSFFHLDVEGGVMITGSHNPPEFNGFKLGYGKTTIHGDEIQKVLQIIQSGQFEQGQGQVSQHDIGAAYMDELVRRIGSLARPLKHRGRRGQRRRRAVWPRDAAPHRGRGDRAVLRAGRPLSQPPPRSHAARGACKT